MDQSKPGGYLGLALVLALFVAGFVFDIEWMRVWGGIGTVVWVAMLVIGFLAGAKG